MAQTYFYYSRTVPLRVANLTSLHTDLHTATDAIKILTGTPSMEVMKVPKNAPFILRITPPIFEPVNLRPRYTRGGDKSSLLLGVIAFDTDVITNVNAKTPMLAGVPNRIPIRHRGKARKLEGDQDFTFSNLATTPPDGPGFQFATGKVLIFVHTLQRFYDDDDLLRTPVAIVANIAKEAA